MIPTSRRLGGVACARDLCAITRSRGGSLDSLRVDRSPCPDNLVGVSERHLAVKRDSDPVILERVAGPSRGPEFSESCDTWRHIHHSLLARPMPQLSLAPQQARGFHTSSRVPYDSTSYNVVDVPEFFVKYKQYHATPIDSGIPERKNEEPGLMHSLTNSVLSGDIVATTRRLKTKIPVEHHATEGRIVHPSGFVVPGPGHTSTSDVARAKEKKRNEDRDRLVQTAAVAHSVLESDFVPVAATTLPAFHKVPVEVREPDGTVKHPSGFVPPTPAHKFRYTVNSGAVWERKVSAVRQKPRQPSPSRAILRAVHTASGPKTSGNV